MMDCSTWADCEWKSQDKALSGIKSLIKEFPDFPKEGVLFLDIMPIFQVPNAVMAMVDMMVKYIEVNFNSVEGIVALEARGFLIGTMVAVKLKKPFIPIRKQGKLPGKCVSHSSTKEYGEDVLEMQEDALKLHQKVVIIDDLMATGGTLKSSCELVRKCNGVVLGCLSLIEGVNRRSQLDQIPFHAFIQH